MPEGIHPVQIGDITCTVIQEGGIEPTVETMYDRFPSVDPAAMSAAFLERHPGGSCRWSMNPLLIQTGEHTVLVDTGTGSGHLNPRVASLVDPAEVDTLVISHGHGDHIGGLIDADGRLVYPNARYVMHRTEWDQWMAPDSAVQADPERATYFADRLGLIKSKLSFVEDGQEVVSSVTACLTPGHTNGHLALRIESNGESLVHLVDAMHAEVQFDHPDWSPRFDTDPVLAARTRQTELERAADEGTLVLLYHLEFPGLGHVVRKGEAFDWQPA